MSYLKIVPVAAEPGRPSKVVGTRVVTEDGQEISGVDHIELVGAERDYWVATIRLRVALEGSDPPVYASTVDGMKFNRSAMAVSGGMTTGSSD